MEKRKVIYYKDEQNDEFSTAVITPRHIGDDYVYVHKSFFKKLTHFFWYKIIAVPTAFVYLKIAFAHKIVNKKILKSAKGGYFLFGNHTQTGADPLIPTMLSLPKDAYVIVHPNNVSIPVIGKIMPSLGALPLPDTKNATRNFLEAIKIRLEQGSPIVIYPEAHIWPYYTKIRHFSDMSFRYPVRSSAPVYCFTNTYQKRKIGKRPKMVTYVDGPFYPDPELSGRERSEKLRDEVYEKMCERAKLSNVEYIKYIREDG